VVYGLQLPQELSNAHPTFQPIEFEGKPIDTPQDEIEVSESLNFVEVLVEIMDREIERTKPKCISIVHVQCNAKREPEFTWEREDQMKKSIPTCFPNVRIVYKN